jgi:FdhD protein
MDLMEQAGGAGISAMPASGNLPLAEESLVSIFLRRKRIAKLLCTPRQLEDLAVGYLFSRGLLADRDALRSLEICPDRSAVFVDLLGPLPEGRGIESIISSACGAGFGEEGDVQRAEFPQVTRQPSISVTDLIASGLLASSMRAMFAQAELYRGSGGLHCAALRFDSGELLVREDVGRHNAIDKVIGRAFLEGRLGSAGMLLTSGRLALDMAWKAATAGIPIVATRSIPTTAARDFALEVGLSMVGRAMAARPFVYAVPKRE